MLHRASAFSILPTDVLAISGNLLATGYAELITGETSYVDGGYHILVWADIIL